MHEVIFNLVVFLGAMIISWVLSYKFNARHYTPVFLTFFGVLFTLAIFSSANSVKGDLKEEHEYYVHSIKNSQETTGSFMLGTGSIDSQEYYYFYYNTNLGFSREKILVKNTYVQETNTRRPELVGLYQHYAGGKYIKNIIYCKEYSPEYYILYVPKGTVISKFEVY